MAAESTPRSAGPSKWLATVGVIMILVLMVVVGVFWVQRSNTPSKQDLLVEAGLLDKPRLRIGVRDDIPGIANLSGRDYVGFDIEIALAVARELGFPRNKVDLLPVEIESRATMQAKKGGQFIPTDLVVASYSITDERKKQGVKFSSPYLETTQAVLTRPGFAGTLQSMSDLRRKKVCTLRTSTAEEPLRRKGIDADARHRISDCVEGLKNKKFDAVQSDAAILGGFIQQDPKGLEFHDITLDPSEKWGVNTGPNEAMHALVELALHRITTGREWQDIYAKYLAPVQQVVGTRQQIAIASPPVVPKPEIREW